MFVGAGCFALVDDIKPVFQLFVAFRGEGFSGTVAGNAGLERHAGRRTRLLAKDLQIVVPLQQPVCIVVAVHCAGLDHLVTAQADWAAELDVDTKSVS